ncbi:hypothetical protein ACB098_01G021600 [Castanea mollissima]
MANRDQPINGKHSKLSLLKNGNLILTDANKLNVWTINTVSLSFVQLYLHNTGNLVLCNNEGLILWESFHFPTDTLLPQQLLIGNTKLVSSRSQTNFSSGFYEFLFGNDYLLYIVYNSPDVSSIYCSSTWPVNNISRIAVLNSLGNFTIQTPCNIPGACGANSLCSYVIGSGRKCSCLPGYKMNRSDWAYGCEPQFHLSCNKNESKFQLLSHADFYGNDFGVFLNYTLDHCKDICLKSCDCKAFQYTLRHGYTICYPKVLLLNGSRYPNLNGNIYLKLPKNKLLSNDNPLEEFSLNCSSKSTLESSKYNENGTVKFMLWFACGVGGLEIICIFVVWFLLIKTRKNSSADKEGYVLATTGFRYFTYAELKKATKGFTEEIGRGAGGIVYKGVLSDSRVAAIKHLNEANQVEGEFLAEVSIIGRIDHMNLIEMWGYCAERKHRLLVYEHMEHGLAYMHEDCLEWILHCDVKPHFGQSKLQNRGVLKNSSFSKIRGTCGYMAPEWVFNLPITSKVDVYSYGIVMLEMVTGKGPSRSVHALDDGGEAKHKRLVTWVRENMKKAAANISSLENIIDPMLEGKYDMGEMEALVQVALECVEEDKTYHEPSS